MSRQFLYCRVSTADQTTSNQVLAAEKAGYAFKPSRIVEEQISGTVPAMERPKFAELVGKLEEEDVLVVTKMDRLGRNAADIDRTIETLRARGVRVIALDLPVTEVTSAAGDLVRRMFAAFAQFERDQLVERTHAGLARAKAEGKTLGRKDALAEIAKKRRIERSALIDEIRAKIAAGGSVRDIGKEYGVSHPVIVRAMQANGAEQKTASITR